MSTERSYILNKPAAFSYRKYVRLFSGEDFISGKYKIMRMWHRWHFPGKKRNSCFSMYILKFSKAFSFADWDQKKLFSDVVIHMLLKNIHRHRDHRFMTSTRNFWNLPRFFGFHRFQIIDILFFFVDGGDRGSQNWYIFVDVINLWPHSLNLSSFIILEQRVRVPN